MKILYNPLLAFDNEQTCTPIAISLQRCHQNPFQAQTTGKDMQNLDTSHSPPLLPHKLLKIT